MVIDVVVVKNEDVMRSAVQKSKESKFVVTRASYTTYFNSSYYIALANITCQYLSTGFT